MARTSTNKVKEIIETGLGDTQIKAHITIANLLVTEHLSNVGYSAKLLNEIERWLAAHFVAVQDPRASSQSLGDKNITYEGRVGEKGLEGTRYGKQVLTMEHHGILKAISDSKGPVKFKAT